MSIFETTSTDVFVVLRNHRASLLDQTQTDLEAYAEKLFEEHILMESDRIEDAAVSGGNSMGEQTDAALEEIRLILVENGILSQPVSAKA